MILARQVDLEDWELVRACWEKYDNSPQAFSDRNSKKIVGNHKMLRSLFKSHIANQGIKIFGLFSSGVCIALMICQEFVVPELSTEGEFFLQPYCFIRAVFASQRERREDMALLDQAMAEWARGRGYLRVSGNCRPNISQAALEGYGYSLQSLVIGREL